MCALAAVCIACGPASAHAGLHGVEVFHECLSCLEPWRGSFMVSDADTDLVVNAGVWPWYAIGADDGYLTWTSLMAHVQPYEYTLVFRWDAAAYTLTDVLVESSTLLSTVGTTFGAGELVLGIGAQPIAVGDSLRVGLAPVNEPAQALLLGIGLAAMWGRLRTGGQPAAEAQ